MTQIKESTTLDRAVLKFQVDKTAFQSEAQAEVVTRAGWWNIKHYKRIPGPRIVFTRWLVAGNSSQIISMNPGDHTDQVNLSGSQTQDTFPSVNPHNGEIVFARGSAYATQLYTMNTDGSGAAALLIATQPGWLGDTSPRWSPNGQHIAFVRYSNEGQQIWIVNADGTGAQPVMDYSAPPLVLDSWPSWSADSKSLAFARQSGGTSTIMKVAITQPASVPKYVTVPGEGFDTFPAWQPVPQSENSLIAFTRNDGEQIAIMTIVAAQPLPPTLLSATNVSQPDYMHGVRDSQPCWSPAGDAIAFSRSPYLDSDIWWMDANGKNQQDISNGPGGNMDSLPDWRKY